MNKREDKDISTNIDILGSVEFDLTEAIKDLIYNIKLIKHDVEMVKQHVNLPKEE